MRSDRPTGVSVIAILYFISGGLSVIAAILALTAFAPLDTALQELGVTSNLGIAVSLVPLITGIVSFAIGWGLWELKEWARIVTIVFNGLALLAVVAGVVLMITNDLVVPSVLFMAVLYGVIYGLIIWYLLRPDIQAYFDGYGGIVDYGPPIEETKPYTPVTPPVTTPAPPRPEPRPAPPPRVDPTLVPRAPAPSAWLVATTGARTGSQFGLTRGRNTIGRDGTQCDLVLDDPAVGRVHAQIRYENGMFILYDLASSNGTFLNNQRIQRQSLMDGDKVRVGDTVMVFKTV